MGKIYYSIQEVFACTKIGEREKRLKSLMNEYIRMLEKQIARNEVLE